MAPVTWNAMQDRNLAPPLYDLESVGVAEGFPVVDCASFFCTTVVQGLTEVENYGD